MKSFPKTAIGMRKLFVAEIIEIIGTILATIGGLIAIGAGTVATAAANEVVEISDAAGAAVVAGGGIGVILAFIGGILALIALIFQIVGLANAAADHTCFKVALIVVVAQIVLTALGSFVPALSGVSNVISICSNVINFIVTILVLTGCMNVCTLAGKGLLAARGKKLMTYIIVANLLSILCSILSGLEVAVIVTGVIYLILTIAIFFMYMSYLKAVSRQLA